MGGKLGTLFARAGHEVVFSYARSEQNHTRPAPVSLSNAVPERRRGLWFPPGEKHWHGATLTSARTHILIQEQLNSTVRSSSGWKNSVANNTKT